jgi:hypothetical protein
MASGSNIVERYRCPGGLLRGVGALMRFSCSGGGCGVVALREGNLRVPNPERYVTLHDIDRLLLGDV